MEGASQPKHQAKAKQTSRKTPKHPEGPHKCQVCQWTFKKVSMLRRHMRKHTGLKPFSCHYDGCDKHFTRVDNMWKHFRTHSKSLKLKTRKIRTQNRTQSQGKAKSKANHSSQGFSTSPPLENVLIMDTNPNEEVEDTTPLAETPTSPYHTSFDFSSPTSFNTSPITKENEGVNERERKANIDSTPLNWPVLPVSLPSLQALGLDFDLNAISPLSRHINWSYYNSFHPLLPLEPPITLNHDHYFLNKFSKLFWWFFVFFFASFSFFLFFFFVLPNFKPVLSQENKNKIKNNELTKTKNSR